MPFKRLGERWPRLGGFGIGVPGSGGAVTYSISGTVYEADGSTAISGAVVALGAYTDTSAGDGTYTITGIPSGTSGSMTCTLTGHNWAAKTISSMDGNLTGQDYTANNYAAIFSKVYSMDEVYPFTDIASPSTTIEAYVSSAHDGTLTLGSGAALQNATGPVTGANAPLFDGSTGLWDIGSLALIWDGTVFEFYIFGKMANSGVWTDGTSRYLLLLQADGSNRVIVQKTTNNNQLRVSITVGGTLRSVNIATSTTDWFMLGATIKDGSHGDEAIVYFNGVAESPVTGFGNWSGTPSILRIGCSSEDAAVFSGWLSYPAFNFGSIKTPTQVGNMYAARLTAGPDVNP